MKNEIKENEYVRIAGGIIARVTNKNKDALLIDRVIRDPMRQDGTIRDWCIFNNEKELIVKHSSNLIDLIQCGDYVNGKEVKHIADFEGIEQPIRKVIFVDETHLIPGETAEDKDIKTIVTKEMMESISYKVKQEEK